MLAGVLRLRQRATGEDGLDRRDATLFALMAMGLVCIAYHGFFLFLSYPTVPSARLVSAYEYAVLTVFDVWRE